MPGYDDIKKMWLQHELILRKLKNYGDIYFVDATNGSDGNRGTDPSSPFKSTEHAIDVVTDWNNDVVIHKGYENLTAGITIDKNKMSLLGWGLFGSNPAFPEVGCIDRSTAEDAPVIGIEAEFVEIAGLAFNGVWNVAGVAGQAPLECVDSLANKTWIHDCFFPDWTRASMTAGIKINGCHYVVVEDCNFQSVYGNMDAGIYIMSAVGAPAYHKVKRCNFMGGSAAMANGIHDIFGSQFFEYEDLSFSYVTNALRFAGAKSLWGTVKGLTGTMTGANICVGGAACDTIANAYTQYKVTLADCWGNDGPLVA